MSGYSRPKSFLTVETVVKNSRFIAAILPIDSLDPLYQLLASLRTEHPKASHHCLAYVLGAPDRPKAAGSNDDGEPSGTAGKPMLGVLQAQKLGDTGVVVTRYFGGTKLGAGGLIRAYSGAVANCLQQLELDWVESRVECQLVYPYSLESEIARLIHQFEAELLHQQYDEQISKRLSVPQSSWSAALEAFQNLEYRGVSLELLT